LICQHCSAVNKNKFTLLTHTYALLFPPVFSWLPGGGGSHPGPCVSLPAAKGLICSATLTLRLQPENRPSPTGGHPFLKKKEVTGRKVGKLNTVALDGHPAKSFSPIQMLISLLTVIGRQSSCFKASGFWTLFSTFSVMKGKHCKIPALLNKTCRWPGAKHCHAMNKCLIIICSMTTGPDLK